MPTRTTDLPEATKRASKAELSKTVSSKSRITAGASFSKLPFLLERSRPAGISKSPQEGPFCKPIGLDGIGFVFNGSLHPENGIQVFRKLRRRRLWRSLARLGRAERR